MNLKNSRCMNRIGYIFAAAMLLIGFSVAGQGYPESVPRYERVHKNNFWNGSRNITGVRQDSVSRSFAEIYGSYETGDFRDTWQPEQRWSAGAVTASIRHLEKISFAGSFRFEQTENYGMCGSMFIKPGYYPIDVLEFTPGRKSLQTYTFDGGVSYDVAPGWRIGAKMDFEAANIAKRKDLRHSNKRLGMTVTPGFMYHNGDFAVGANYIFGKTSETIEAEQVGTSESSYWAFLDKGMMYGVHSVWTGSGIHLQENGVKGLPVNEFSNGIAVQAQWKGLFTEIEYMNIRGRIGEKEYIWFEFPGNSLKAQAGYSFNTWPVRHNARLKFGWKGLGLDENVHEKVTVNGVNTILKHGTNRILSREVVSLSPEYEIVDDSFEVFAGADFLWMNSIASQIYPYLNKQKLFTYNVRLGILLRVKRFEIEAECGIADGKVTEQDRITDDISGVQGEPFRLQEWYQKNIDYLTSGKSSAEGTLRYNFRNGMYLEGSCHILTRGIFTGVTDEFHDRSEVTLKFGYNF